MKKQLLQLKKSLIIASMIMPNLSFVNEDGIDELYRLVMVGEMSEEDYEFYNEKRLDGIDPMLRLAMVGEERHHNKKVK